MNHCTTCDAYGMTEPATTTEHPVVNDGRGGLIRNTDSAPIDLCDDCAKEARRCPLDSLRALDILGDPDVMAHHHGDDGLGVIVRQAVADDPNVTVEEVLAIIEAAETDAIED